MIIHQPTVPNCHLIEYLSHRLYSIHTQMFVICISDLKRIFTFMV